MRQKALGLWVVAATVVGTARCAGTDTGNPATSLVSFDGSSCVSSDQPPPSGPKGSADGGIGTSRAALTSNEEDFFRLRCIYWELGEDSTLRINFWNIGAGCGVTWAGASARFDGDTLHLDAYQKGCSVAACGACIYDLHFEIRGAPKGADIPLFFDYTDEHEQHCDLGGYYPPAPTSPTFTIPTSTEPSGTRCNPIVGGVGLHVPPTCFRHAACGDGVVNLETQEPCPVCPNGDLCAPITDPITDGYPNECLAPCATDADCPNRSMACRGGGCAVVAKW